MKPLSDYLPQNGFSKIHVGTYKRGNLVFLISRNPLKPNSEEWTALKFSNGEDWLVLYRKSQLKMFIEIYFGEKMRE